jgi:hypothetical protein
MKKIIRVVEIVFVLRSSQLILAFIEDSNQNNPTTAKSNIGAIAKNTNLSMLIFCV